MSRHRSLSVVRAIALISIWGAVLVLAWPPIVHAAGGRKWALVVGVDRYDHPQQIHSLRYAGADAKAVATVLVQNEGFPASNVFLMTSDSGTPPTRDNIVAKFAALQSLVQPGDTFVFFFSGHGAESGEQRWLLTANTIPNSPLTVGETALDVKKVRENIQELKAARILELVDACANNPWGKKGINSVVSAGMERDFQVSASGSNGELDAAVTIMSCKEGQTSYETGEGECKGHGYFTYYLVKGLKGAARQSGAVTVTSLASYLAKHVPSAVARNENGQQQIPWANIEGADPGSWVLSGTPQPGTAESPPSSAPTPAAAPRMPAAAPAAVSALPPTVVVSFPKDGFATADEQVALAAMVTGGGRLSEVTVTVNGHGVELGGGLHQADMGAIVNAEVPLQPGNNAITVNAISESGRPAQVTLMVTRNATASAVAPQPKGIDGEWELYYSMGDVPLVGGGAVLVQHVVISSGHFNFMGHGEAASLTDGVRRIYRIERTSGPVTFGIDGVDFQLSEDGRRFSEIGGHGIVCKRLLGAEHVAPLQGIDGEWEVGAALMTISSGTYEFNLVGDVHKGGVSLADPAKKIYHFVQTSGPVFYGFDNVDFQLTDNGLTLVELNGRHQVCKRILLAK